MKRAYKTILMHYSYPKWPQIQTSSEWMTFWVRKPFRFVKKEKSSLDCKTGNTLPVKYKLNIMQSAIEHLLLSTITTKNYEVAPTLSYYCVSDQQALACNRSVSLFTFFYFYLPWEPCYTGYCFGASGALAHRWNGVSWNEHIILLSLIITLQCEALKPRFFLTKSSFFRLFTPDFLRGRYKWPLWELTNTSNALW